MPWLILIIAGLLEVGWATGLKASDGLTKPGPTAATLLMLAASMGLLALAMRSLPLGTAYAVWTGIGTVGAALIGVLFFNEPATAGRIACIGLIVTGIIGLKLLTPSA